MPQADSGLTRRILDLLTLPAQLPGLRIVSSLIVAALLDDGADRPRSGLLATSAIAATAAGGTLPMLAAGTIVAPLTDSGEIPPAAGAVGLWAICLYAWTVSAIHLEAMRIAARACGQALHRLGGQPTTRQLLGYFRPSHTALATAVTVGAAMTFLIAESGGLPAAIAGTGAHAALGLVAAAAIIRTRRRV